jgi:hypothetical protein
MPPPVSPWLGHIIIRLPNDDALSRELLTYKKTDKYIISKNDGTLSESTKRILHSFAAENRDRRSRLGHLLEELLVTASYLVAGQSLVPKSTSASGALDEALEYLVRNTFTKMGLLKRLHDEPLKEIQAVLKTNDIGQLQLGPEERGRKRSGAGRGAELYRACVEDEQADRTVRHDGWSLCQPTVRLAAVGNISSGRPVAGLR